MTVGAENGAGIGATDAGTPDGGAPDDGVADDGVADDGVAHAGATEEGAVVFRALADPTRRAVLDALFVSDGQSLGELAALVPTMSRFGVMKHLRVLEEANLVTTVRSGRTKRHFLNPVPIAQIAERWITKYSAPYASALLDLRRQVAEEATQQKN